ncbi:ankyrin repeat domain-containing protein [Isoptericola sp. NPDC056618]|uniref:ankyrin repeat domain-containing protein n=1 Tax=Isoptericola sp. NPDC056618 TaxID=3345878 RepID=UPI0036AE922C
MATTLRTLLLGQVEFYWDAHLWPRLQGLTDDEYLWEPVDGAWSLRRDDGGTVRIELTPVDPPVPPVTTIAWRAAHLGRDVWGTRGRALFGPTTAPADADMFDARHWPEPLPLTAAGGLGLLREGYELWRDHLSRLDDDALAEPLGPRGGPYADDSLAALVVHLNREAMAHGAEICLLRDLYRAQRERRDPVVATALGGSAADLERMLRLDGGLGDLPDRHPTLLVELAGLGRWDAVRSLAERGFPVTVAADDGSTALHYAATTGTPDDARLLLDHGADPSAVDARFGTTPAGWAQFLGRTELAETLAP